jgi:hypothetical protein
MVQPFFDPKVDRESPIGYNTLEPIADAIELAARHVLEQQHHEQHQGKDPSQQDVSHVHVIPPSRP